MSRAQPVPAAQRQAVVVFRRELLNWPETFIASQVSHYRRYRPILAGLREVPNGLPLDGLNTEVAAAHGRCGEASVRWARRIPFWPSAWLRALKRQRARALHVHFGIDAAWCLPLARRLRLPLVVTFHGYDATALESPERAKYRSRLPQVFAAASAVVAVSQFIGQRVIALGCPPEKVHVIPLGIDVRRFVPGPAPREPAVLFVGRMVHKKGVEHLLRAAPAVLARLADARFVLIGDGPLRSSLEDMARPLGDRVGFLGRLPPEEVMRWLQRATVLAVPSVTAADGDTEGLPTVVLEAMASGIAVVASRHAGIPEAIEDGISGLLCAEGDHEALARAIERLMTDDGLRARIVSAARSAVTERFDQSRLVARLEDLYDRLPGGGR